MQMVVLRNCGRHQLYRSRASSFTFEFALPITVRPWYHLKIIADHASASRRLSVINVPCHFITLSFIFGFQAHSFLISNYFCRAASQLVINFVDKWLIKWSIKDLIELVKIIIKNAAAAAYMSESEDLHQPSVGDAGEKWNR